ncbi:type I restriction-modification system subunit M [Sulfurimonas sp.]|uniref:type I restriction-modification system subunit M n=1 Tax=Sulfurimonas sp. TaxID=2022749 RepID=UPI00262408FB|nr:type I restriction-modification system subunit M [Sulfurimonas sp.]MDD3854538.1 type I restriction-modification system subunit M [Sulfurimonas sp.]
MKQKITLQKLETFLFSLADDLRSKMDANEYKYYIIGLIFIKRLSDEFSKAQKEVKKKYKHLLQEFQDELIEDVTSYGDTFFVPKRARWHEGYMDDNGNQQPPIKHLKSNIGERLNKAIAAIEESNDRLSGVLKNNIDFNASRGKNSERVKDNDWKSLINKLEDFGSLSGENFEFPDLLGAAYEYLIKYFADSAGKKGGEFYTPNEVVRLMVQIIEPKEGESVYDPTVGSGGMLIQSHQYVDENGQDTNKISLNGQENDGGVWATCIMNMILHDVKDFEIEHGNTLEEPLFKDAGGKYKKFDKILANPPFSMDYKKENLTQTSRYRWGYAPETKKADLMFVEHMASSLKKNGLMASVVPHGVLFRGSKEKDIRASMLEDNLIDAVIGLPPALFYGTGIPAAIIVIKKNRKENEKVLFINADAEYAEEKARNRLRASDIEKISYVYREKDVSDEKYSKLISLKTIREHEYNLNIRRYVDNSAPTEIEDVKAHLKGGIPKREVTIHQNQFDKFDFDFSDILKALDDEYLEFISNENIKEQIESNANVKSSLEVYGTHLIQWWDETNEEFSQLEHTHNINKTKTTLIKSFKNHFERLQVLDKFQVAGVFVEWWNSIKYDLKTISASGFGQSLLSDEILIEAFFKDEKEEIEDTEIELSQKESALGEVVEEVDYDTDEDKEGNKEDKKPASAKAYLKDTIKSLEFEEKEPYVSEREVYKKQLKTIEVLEKSIKELKAKKKTLEYELKIKVKIKRYGELEELDNVLESLQAIEKELQKKDLSKKELTKLQSDKTKLKEAQEKLNKLLKEVAIITKEEAKELTLQKHHNLISSELNSGLKEELNTLYKIFENLDAKYAKSLKDIEDSLEKSETKIDKYLRDLGYIGE